MQRSFKVFLRYVFIALMAFFLSAFVFSQRYFIEIAARFNDFLYSTSFEQSGDIVLITIDDKSLRDEELGRWQNWQRSYYADVIEFLKDSGAKTIGVDVLFSELSDAQNDQEVSKAIDKKVVLAAKTDLPRPNIFFQEASWGYVDIPLDKDGVSRSMSVKDSSQLFSIEIVKNFLGIENDTILKNNQLTVSSVPVRLPWDASTRVDAIEIPVQNNKVWINFFGKPRSYPRVSFTDVYHKRVNAEFFKNKIVLIGEDGAGLFDEQLTPVSHGIKMPGVEIHANMIETMLQGKFLEPQHGMMFFIAAIVIAATLLFALSSMWLNIFLLLAGYVFIMVLGVIGFSFGSILEIFYLFIAFTISFAGVFAYRYFSEEKQKTFIKKAFSQYVSADLLETMMNSSDNIQLGGERRELTVFFSDIEGFTSISEHMKAEDLVQLLNEYLTIMTDIILEEKGTIDKYEGDAIMAFWGAPLPFEDHALYACRAALRCQEALKDLRKKWRAKDLPEFRVRIGINTGEMVVGNVGSKKRFEYTVIGDAVNLGARLEGVNKQYNTSIIVSDNTKKAVVNHMELRCLDRVRVKGRSDGETIYELVGMKGKISSAEKDLKEKYKDALHDYFYREFASAIKKFSYLAKKYDDHASKVMVKRSKSLEKKNLGPEWDGVFDMKTK